MAKIVSKNDRIKGFEYEIHPETEQERLAAQVAVKRGKSLTGLNATSANEIKRLVEELAKKDPGILETELEFGIPWRFILALFCILILVGLYLWPDLVQDFLRLIGLSP